MTISTLSLEDSLLIAGVSGSGLEALCKQATQKRDQHYGQKITFSPKIFLPLTNLCWDRCDYCTFRRDPGSEWTMTPAQVTEYLQQGQSLGCTEALFCLGDKPDRFPIYQKQLANWGFEDTIHYLEWAGEQALHYQLLPHTNAGVLTREQMIRLQRVNVSLGLMLENSSPRLCLPGMVHSHAPDKDPTLRIQMHQEAGELRIPFTTGLLVGIGETEKERVESLAAIREIHDRYHHIQEVIIQPLRIHADTPLAKRKREDQGDNLDTLVRTIALARLMLPSEVSVQAPPNLSAPFIGALINAGINDFGGISPLTPDYINPEYPWPHLDQLKVICEQRGYELVPRLPIYPHYLSQTDYIHPSLRDPIQRVLSHSHDQKYAGMS